MRAVAVTAFGQPPQLMDVDPPEPGAGEVRVRMSAAGLNPFDWKIADGVLKDAMPTRFPLVLGVDGAGYVDRVGPGTSRFVVGDPIFGQFLHSPVGIGTVAEYSTVPESIGVAKFPPELEPDAAAALPTAGMTAVRALDVLELRAGNTLVVVGASGGIGSYAIQLGRARGLRVTAVARAGATDRLRTLGASEVIDYAGSGLAERLRQRFPDGVDGLLDTFNAGPEFARLAGVVRRGGHAATSVHAAPPDLSATLGVTVVNVALQSNTKLLERLLHEVEEHHLVVPVERRIPIEDAPAAYAESKAGRAVGKTVVHLGATSG